MEKDTSILHKLRIGKIEIFPPLILAPMSRITNLCFRKLIAHLGGCGLFFTEMISAEGLVRGNEKTKNLLKSSSLDKPLFYQIFGSEPKTLGRSASILRKIGVSGIDINMSCPQEKVVKKKAGAALLKDIKLAEKIIKEVVKQAGAIPVSVKIRAGWSRKEINAIEFAKMIESSGASAIIIHPRVRYDFFSSFANWELIAEIKKAVSIPVIGNGDIKSPKDISEMFNQTGCDGVMIGRGAIEDPLIFKKFICSDKENITSNSSTKKMIFLKYLEILEDEKLREKEKINSFKKFTIWGTKGLIGGRLLRKKIILSETFQEIKQNLEEFFGQEKNLNNKNCCC